MYQPAPGKPYKKPEVTISNTQLNAVTDFCYPGSILVNDATLDKELTSRSNKTSSSLAGYQAETGSNTVLSFKQR